MSRVRLLALQVFVAVAAVLLWHVLTSVPDPPHALLARFFLSTPADVGARLLRWVVKRSIWEHLWITLVEAVLAFVTGSIAGVAGGFWFELQPIVAAVFDPYVKMANALPRVVLGPIFALWFGL